MTTITFVQSNGEQRQIEATDGLSLMQAAVSHNIPGIDADCGGAISCGTCVVCVRDDWKTRIGTRSEMEHQMLEFSVGDNPSFRLSCQIVVTPELDGLVVSIPDLHA